MNKWVLVLLILLIVVFTFLVLGLVYGIDLGFTETIKDFFTGNSIPSPPALPA